MMENNGIDIIHDENSHFKNKLVKVKAINKYIFWFQRRRTAALNGKRKQEKMQKTERGNWVGRSKEWDIFFYFCTNGTNQRKQILGEVIW